MCLVLNVLFLFLNWSIVSLQCCVSSGVQQSDLVTCIFNIYIYIWLNKRSHIGEGNGSPLQYSCLENPMDGGAWWAAIHGVTQSRTRLSNLTFTFTTEYVCSRSNIIMKVTTHHICHILLVWIKLKVLHTLVVRTTPGSEHPEARSWGPLKNLFSIEKLCRESNQGF